MKQILSLFLTLFALTANAKVYHTGLLYPHGWEKLAKFHEFPGRDDLPKEYDVAKVLGKMPSIRNQGSCGSCWAFAATRVGEYLDLMKHGTYTQLSPQHLVACDRTAYGCGGGFVSFPFMINPGTTSEVSYPYKAKNTRCPSGLEPVQKLYRWGYVGAQNRRPTTDEIKRAILTHGPVWADISANNAFAQGNFQNCRQGQGNHAIVLRGWTADGKWLLDNSWGSSWGPKHNGTVDIPFGCNSVGSVVAFAELTPSL